MNGMFSAIECALDIAEDGAFEMRRAPLLRSASNYRMSRFFKIRIVCFFGKRVKKQQSLTPSRSGD